MAALDVLRDKLNGESDGQLRQKIEGRLNPIRELTRNTPSFDVAAGTYTAETLLNKLSDLAFNERRDQARAQIVEAFLRRVEKMGD